MAEVHAILEGMRLCMHLGISNFIIETDCALAFDIISKKMEVQWIIVYMVRLIWGLLSNNNNINLIFREQNSS